MITSHNNNKSVKFVISNSQSPLDSKNNLFHLTGSNINNSNIKSDQNDTKKLEIITNKNKEIINTSNDYKASTSKKLFIRKFNSFIKNQFKLNQELKTNSEKYLKLKKFENVIINNNLLQKKIDILENLHNLKKIDLLKDQSKSKNTNFHIKFVEDNRHLVDKILKNKSIKNYSIEDNSDTTEDNKNLQINMHNNNKPKAIFVENGIFYKKNLHKSKSKFSSACMSKSLSHTHSKLNTLISSSRKTSLESIFIKKQKEIKIIEKKRKENEMIKNKDERIKAKLSNFIVYGNYLNREDNKNSAIFKETSKAITEYNKEFEKSDPKMTKLKDFLSTVSPPDAYKPQVYYQIGRDYDIKKNKNMKIITNDKNNIFYRSHFVNSLTGEVAYKYRKMIAEEYGDPSIMQFMNAYYTCSTNRLDEVE